MTMFAAKTRKTLLLSSFLLLINALHAQNFGLLKNINTSQDANPINQVDDLYLESNTTGFNVFITGRTKYLVVNNVAYFGADDGVNGTELWRSDGTAAGTYMVKDITPGVGSTVIESLTQVGNKIYFTASRIVWVTDGTAAGTYAVPGIDYTSDITTCLTAVGNTLYFVTNVSRLWKTDGTLGGTSLVIDFRATYFYTKDFLGQLTNVNGTLFFTTGLDNTTGPELWRSDGSFAGTYMVKDINPGVTGSAPVHLTAAAGKLYFSANDGSGEKLWMSDGTANGTNMVPNNNNILLTHDNNKPFTFVNNTLCFKGAAPNKGYELCYYTPGSGNVALLKDLVPGAGNSNPENITNTNNALYFTATNAAGKQQLWTSNGTPGGTTPLLTATGNASVALSDLSGNGATLFFSYKNAANGNELWKTNGTVAGTVLVKDIFPGSFNANPMYTTGAGGGMSLFSANDGSTGIELWRTNGTAGGTALIKNINTTTDGNSNPLLYDVASLNGKLFFNAYEPRYENEPYISNGTAAGTQLLKDINTTGYSNPTSFTPFKNKIFFGANSGTNWSIYASDGTAAGTQSVFALGPSGSINKFAAGTDWIYVIYTNLSNNHLEIWKSDGTTGGSLRLDDLSATYGYSAAAVGNTLFFSLNNAASGNELWKSPGTVNGATMVKDINPGTASSNPITLYAYNSKVYFGASDANNDYAQYFYTSDGTAAGTYRVKDVNAFGGFEFVQARGKLFFNGNTPDKGYELYKSDGTSAGTSLVKDIYSGTNGCNPGSLTVLDSTVYFAAFDSTFQTGLWKTTGTSASTKLVKYVNIANYRRPMAVTAGKLYFTAYDEFGRPRLWMSDGKTSGTEQISDPGINDVIINEYTGNESIVFFSGNTYQTGNELYGGVSPSLAKPVISADAVTTAKGWNAGLKENPIRNEIVVNITSSREQKLHLSLVDISGKQWITESRSITTTTALLYYDAGKLLPGMYLLRITAEDGTMQVLKLVKQ